MKPQVKDQADDLSPAQRRRLRVRTKILDAAEEVFALEGSAGLSIRRLAASVDYSPAAIYKYFESKEMLVDHLRESFINKMNTKLTKACDTDAPIKERTVKGLEAYILAALASPHHYNSIWEQEDRMADYSDQALHNSLHNNDWSSFPKTNSGRGFSALVKLVESGQDEGLFLKESAAQEYAKVLWAGAHGIVMLTLNGPTSTKSHSSKARSENIKQISTYAATLVRGICTTLD